MTVKHTTVGASRPRPGRAYGLGAVAVALTALVAACSSGAAADPDPTAGDGSAVAGVDPPKVAFTTSYFPATYLNTRYGPIEYGPEYGMDYTEDDYTVFDSHATAMQAMLSGSADIIGGSFVSDALLREQGQDIQVFCPFVNGDTLALVARNGITTADELFDPSTRVATDSPGGAGSLVFNALLEHMDAPGLVDDLPNTTILESSSLRATALASDQVDAAVIQMQQYLDMQDEVPDATVLASFADDVSGVVMQAYAATESWLQENEDVAVDFCATVLRANEALAADFDLFSEAANTFMDEPPTPEQLRTTFDLINDAGIWPEDLTDEAVEYTLGLGVRSGVLSGDLPVDEIVNRQVLDAAIARAADAG